MISRTQLRQFLAVVDAGNFTKAADRINLTQPSLSMGIAELERQLGTMLFIREKRRIRLTDAGNRFLPYARGIERDFRLAERGVASVPAPVRPIRLGVLHSYPTSLLAQSIASFAGDEPLELVEGGERELAIALANGGIDLAVTILKDDHADFVDQLLFAEDYRLAIADSHSLAGAASLTVADVAGEAMIPRRSCELLAITSRFFTEKGARPRFSMRSGNDDRVMAMVRARLGMTIAPQSLGGPGIVMVPLEGFAFTRSVGLRFGADWQVHYGLAHPLPRAFKEIGAGHSGSKFIE